MTGPARTALRWERREPPLPVAGVAGLGPAAVGLAVATRERLAAGAGLRAAADSDTLVVLGEPGELPWAEGVRYLGWDGGALVPTTARPWPSAALWREALVPTAASDGGAPRLVVLLPEAALVAELPTRSAAPEALDLVTGYAAAVAFDGGPEGS
ncbi:hypothetical protein C7C46_07285 [Streptomyces tateyamensis]|uniref:MoxR-vWA-beta-propeller ternary system domain-containing protein n=1 Tax=Streptomyces tateyamensis TaxID=565073 RepID=A0A2V4NGX8_9ACTN|nr:hypothetical protein [Streptomyces tateyamensis]PYC84708.1 hypothetical protein C7C46_07285 [Streptomyces tateyamensis]